MTVIDDIDERRFSNSPLIETDIPILAEGRTTAAVEEILNFCHKNDSVSKDSKLLQNCMSSASNIHLPYRG